MTDYTGSLVTMDHSGSRWALRAVLESAIKASRCFFSELKRAAARERTRRQLAELDARMLQDIGLEPFDVYYGWQGSCRAGR